MQSISTTSAVLFTPTVGAITLIKRGRYFDQCDGQMKYMCGFVEILHACRFSGEVFYGVFKPASARALLQARFARVCARLARRLTRGAGTARTSKPSSALEHM
eukprot:1379857-Pleurochrysis_carterae.AAC.2